MPTVVIAPTNVVGSPEFGGHAWVYLQYAQGLRELGCEVYWLERFHPTGDPERDAGLRALLRARLARYGLEERILLYTLGEEGSPFKGRPQREGAPHFLDRPQGEGAPHFLDRPQGEGAPHFLDRPQREAESILRRAELLLNFHYAMAPGLLARFRRTALVDIDPGLLQWWISTGQLRVAPHDLHVTIGETVGRPEARFPDCGRAWVRIRPPVALSAWPPCPGGDARAFTTVSSWWGGSGSGEWVTDGREVCYENNKRASFLAFLELPHRTRETLELALSIGEGDPPESRRRAASEWRPERVAPADATDYVSDAVDVARLRAQGWLVRDAREVAGSPEDFRAYVQSSRGEFSCAKPSCMAFQNAWISDRTLCYLATARPVVVQHTGPSEYLPSGLGMFRFRDLDEAAAALEAIASDYPRHRRAAREIAEAYFDARTVLSRLLDVTLGGDPAGASAQLGAQGGS